MTKINAAAFIYRLVPQYPQSTKVRLNTERSLPGTVPKLPAKHEFVPLLWSSLRKCWPMFLRFKRPRLANPVRRFQVFAESREVS
jgi:hypothetical protein